MHGTHIVSIPEAEITLNGRVVCIVDDDDLYRPYLASLLKQEKINIVEASDGASLMARLDVGMPDCILLDYNLRSESGLGVLEKLRARYIDLAPVVILSADESQKAAVRSFRNGAADFIGKRNLQLADVIRSVRSAIVRRDEDVALAEELERLRAQKLLDDLTGVYTRRAVEERLEIVSRLAAESGKAFGIVAIVLTQFEAIAGRFGLAAADRALRAFALRLREHLRADDLCGRHDRDVFYYIIDDNPDRATLAAVRSRLEHGLSFPFHLNAVRIDLTATISAVLAPDDGSDLAELGARLAADLARSRARSLSPAEGAAEWATVPDDEGAPVDGKTRERRREVRIRTLKPGRIVINELSSTIDCTIRNQSDGGARLRLNGPYAVPEHFHLRISDTGMLRRVRKCWHINNDVGVQFLAAHG